MQGETILVMGFCGKKKVMHHLVKHAPRKGDTVRLSESSYYKVKEVCWCYDEPEHRHTRVNVELGKIIK